jgi:hypothetical protein
MDLTTTPLGWAVDLAPEKKTTSKRTVRSKAEAPGIHATLTVHESVRREDGEGGR